MFFGLSEEQEQFHDYVKKFLTDNVTVDEIRKIASGEDVALQQEIYGGLINLGINALLVSNGSQNVAVGGFALDANTTANNNVAIGYNALTCLLYTSPSPRDRG